MYLKVLPKLELTFLDQKSPLCSNTHINEEECKNHSLNIALFISNNELHVLAIQLKHVADCCL